MALARAAPEVEAPEAVFALLQGCYPLGIWCIYTYIFWGYETGRQQRSEPPTGFS